ncbi:hypothetical protein [Streptomyces sp. CBMA152]|uniref:hypothetical protein n=1 Tax=Streptomyces sp. CBMA152 TaxID=1896312 RepID=UPI0016614875|nr:hypothetical protein [Streptomyces sp. CBMA152]
MFAYELHQVNQAELLREAAAQRLVREARRARRTAGHVAEGRVTHLRDLRHLFAHAA